MCSYLQLCWATQPPWCGGCTHRYTQTQSEFSVWEWKWKSWLRTLQNHGPTSTLWSSVVEREGVGREEEGRVVCVCMRTSACIVHTCLQYSMCMYVCAVSVCYMCACMYVRMCAYVCMCSICMLHVCLYVCRYVCICIYV